MGKEQLEKYKIWLNKHKKVSKGWILTCVLIIGMMISLTICYSMKSFVNRNFYMKNYVEYNLKENEDQRNKEHLMTSFNDAVLKNIEIIKAETVDNYFQGEAEGKLINYEEGYITYDTKDKIFSINGLSRIYRFTVEINENKVIYDFKEN